MSVHWVSLLQVSYRLLAMSYLRRSKPSGHLPRTARSTRYNTFYVLHRNPPVLLLCCSRVLRWSNICVYQYYVHVFFWISGAIQHVGNLQRTSARFAQSENHQHERWPESSARPKRRLLRWVITRFVAFELFMCSPVVAFIWLLARGHQLCVDAYGSRHCIAFALWRHLLCVLSVEAMKTVGVNSYNEISQKIDEGTKNRTVASTNMNATSRWVITQAVIGCSCIIICCWSLTRSLVLSTVARTQS